MKTAAWQKEYLGVMAMRPDPAGHRIALQSNVLTTGWEYMETATQGRFYTNYLEQVLRHYAAIKWNENFTLVSCHASPAWTSRAMFEPEQARSIFALDLKVSVSDRVLKSLLTRAKLYTLALPSLIAMRESTATIHRTHVLNFYELSSYLGAAWRRLESPILSNVATRVHLQLEPETRGD